MNVNSVDELLDFVDIDLIKSIAVEAGKSILAHYKQDIKIEYKEDDSPITTADKKANDIICNSLQGLYPNIPILSEENESIDYDIRKEWQYYWCIDPLDGTRGFITQTDEFTVNIALVHKNSPILGVVYAPCFKKLYYAQKDKSAFLETLDSNLKMKNKHLLPRVKRKKKFFSVCISRKKKSIDIKKYLFKCFRLRLKNIKVDMIGSSLKMCATAEGKFTSCAYLHSTKIWDIAASKVILEESGYKFLFKDYLKEYTPCRSQLRISQFLVINEQF